MVQSQNARVGRGEGRGRENTNGSIIERHFQRSCVKLFCIRTGTGVSGQEGLVIILLAFPFSCLPLARVCPILLPNSVTWSLWEATGEPGPQWFSPARAKASCSLPLYLSISISISISISVFIFIPISVSVSFSICLYISSPKDILFSLLLEREEWRGRIIDVREKHQLVASICTWTGYGRCPDWESDLQPFGYRTMLQPTGPHCSFSISTVHRSS